MNTLRQDILATRERLARGLQEFKQQHRAGGPAGEVCAAVTEQRDEVLIELFNAALQEPSNGAMLDPETDIVLVAHGGYGRGDLAPYSDVDLMILHAPSARSRVAPLAERLLRDVFDVGLIFGHSVRTPEQAAGLAAQDPVVATSLIESRLLTGSPTLYARYDRAFRRQIRRQPRRMMTGIVAERHKERTRYGETVFLLEPNIKRSRGGLRDLHLLRWIGYVRYGSAEPEALRKLDVLSQADLEAVQKANALLMRLRNEMHFHHGKPNDTLDRAEQLRMAEWLDYQAPAGMLPVERFMQDYFLATNEAAHVTTRFIAAALSQRRVTRLVNAVFGHNVQGDYQVGPAGIEATPHGLEQTRGNLTAIIRMADLANLYDKPIEPQTWEAVRREAPNLPEHPEPQACDHFLSLLSHPARLESLLRDLHDTRVLDRFVPAMAHARALLQFNQYHKYTVDEHCLRAVGFAAGLMFDMGPLGPVYRTIKQKRVLHLALLIHDLGKGFEEDHCTVGARIAEQTAERLGLPESEAEDLKFLVEQHLLMNHLAFREDTSDTQLVERFAAQVGTPERLRMLFVLTAADLAAVGPDVWDDWKARIVSELFERTMAHFEASSH